MKPTEPFHGFSRKSISFFSRLRKNNSREWFLEHKPEYETHVMAPAKAFVAAMGRELKRSFPGIIAVPSINRSIFRINRDTRFSTDKTPYKTHLALWFWEGTRPRMECSGFYIHLEPGRLMLGVGIYMFPRNMLGAYRSAVVHPQAGKKLGRIVKQIEGLEGYSIGGRHYKRIPAAFDPGHPNAELLLNNGLYAGKETGLPEELFSADFVAYCRDQYKPLKNLHRWLVELTASPPVE